MHDLRHSAATLLLSRSVPIRVVSEMLGHADVSITLSIYAHVLPDMQDKAADAMGDALPLNHGVPPSCGFFAWYRTPLFTNVLEGAFSEVLPMSIQWLRVRYG